MDRSLEHYLVREDNTLRDTVMVMKGNGRGLAVVVDDERQVVGAVTDTDVRRAVLEGAEPEDPVVQALRDRPVVVPAESDKTEVEEAMAEAPGGCVPVVDHGRLVDLHLPPSHRPTRTALIMAGGRGQRLRPLTDKVPKPLLRVGTTSIIERLISSLPDAGVQRVHLAVNYKSEAFEERLGDGSSLGVTMSYLRERKKLGTAGALSLVPGPPKDPLLVLNADIVTSVNFARVFDFHEEMGAAITVCAFEHTTSVPYGVVEHEGCHLTGYVEKPEQRCLCSGGIYVLEPEVVEMVPPNTELDIPDLIAAVHKERLPVAVFPILETYFDIGSPEQFERVLLWFAIGEED